MRSTTSASARAPATRPHEGSPIAPPIPSLMRSNSRSARRRDTELGRGRDVACATHQALAVFEQAQLLAPVARRLAVGADRDRHAGGEPAGQVREAVAEVGLGARAQDDAGAARGDGGDLLRRRVRRVDELPARVEASFANEPFDRPSAGRADALVDLAGLLGDVDVDRPGEAIGERRQRRDRCRAGRAQRVDREPGIDAAAGARPGSVAPPRTSPRPTSESDAGRRAGRRRRSPRARTAPAGSSGRCRHRRPHRRAPTTSPADRRARCRRGRGAGSGTRRHGCSRRAAARRRAAPRPRAAAPGRCAARPRTSGRATTRSRRSPRRAARPGRRRRAGRRGCARRRRREAAARRRRSRPRARARRRR